ncbi:hypothetical protein BVRB_1g005750 [Beta vulgaris subsp. vulgaris]|uniref:uncharacterized protein LOC104888494 n=1 Tax=Beta vulgaris subsp. vulgaris TaxID=3555 RepID=UPI00053FAB8C|nr:uncharacterized protein LOC104888494 [Beta vulgaris subsp. vulgaris]KMT20593.1 hypothetical protein BVRB_1g005750 [Beta vulgaris subsp. vulgaris]
MDDSKKKQVEHQQEREEDEATESTLQFFEGLGISLNLPEISNSHDFLSQLVSSDLKVDHISRGHVTCSFSVQPPIANYYKGLHGGAVAAITERLATACTRTIVSEEKPLFLGEMSISYLSAVPMNTKLIADGSVVRSGRNLTVVSVEIRLKETKKLVYTAQATFYHFPTAKL